jgi:hypothetical protein
VVKRVFIISRPRVSTLAVLPITRIAKRSNAAAEQSSKGILLAT